ncbi:hypothetical protein [Winogradskyella sp. 3972H.M.0a.05]|uniref:hypothetical protein n=1 Tax=Winogradskyella sp. 3972H.M.0a.05 TaxID=2950277 RepID=UPI0033907C74
MKTTKMRMLLLLACILMTNLGFAQDKEPPTMFVVHTDYVNFNKMMQYEEAAKALKENCEKHDIQDVDWLTVSIEDGRYVYVSAIENMAELDNNPMASLFEKMGQEEAGALFNKMDECYDSHGNTIVHYMPELSYNPEGYSTEGKNYREYHFLYYSPKDSKAMNEGMKAVKDMFAAKGVKNGYNVYHSGFGEKDSYYMVSIAGKDDIAVAQGGKENDEILGDERQATFYKVISLTTKYDQVNGRLRPDLSYTPAKK